MKEFLSFWLQNKNNSCSLFFKLSITLFSFSLFLSDIKYTTIYEDEANTAASSSLFTKISFGNSEDNGAVSASSS